ncbi:MAG: beta-galactosidase [Butyrivibrio sp.]|nr:beta-galactosidase [Butyrivibrio sp.]
MIENSKVKKILYGGDYNPEQWPENTWEEDMKMLKKAHINILTLNVFSWGLLQPEEDKYDFSMLDKIMDMVKENGFKVFLATSTGAHPAWMPKKYPDTVRVEGSGLRRRYGRRHSLCPNSPNYRKFSSALAGKLAERYAGYDNVVAWHVNNEYNGMCFCENCERAFHEWLKDKYKTIDKVNEAWNANFWSHTYQSFDEIVPPYSLSETNIRWGSMRTSFQGLSLDYARFMSDSFLECFLAEKKAIELYTPGIPVTTNFMGIIKHLDMHKWADKLDIVGWDNYPGYKEEPAAVGFRHEIMRGLQHGRPFALMEQSPSVNNWDEYCRMKRPGVMRLWSYQALAHGADTVMFFQMKRSIGSCEKFHGAVIDHSGRDDTRVFKEVSALGDELERKLAGQILGARTNSEVAIIFDWENWWAVENSAGPSSYMHYMDEVVRFYKGFFKNNISVDVIGTKEDFSKYKLVVAPLLYMNKNGFDQKVREYVNAGGNFITSFFSGYVDENDNVITGGYPGKWQDFMGLWIEESDALPPEETNFFNYKGKTYEAGFICDILRLEKAKALASYGRDFYKGVPVISENRFGKGKTYHVGTKSDDEFYQDFLSDICRSLRIKPISETVSKDLEITIRENENGRFIFILNHKESKEVVLPDFDGTDLLTGEKIVSGTKTHIPSYGVMVIRVDE